MGLSPTEQRLIRNFAGAGALLGLFVLAVAVILQAHFDGATVWSTFRAHSDPLLWLMDLAPPALALIGLGNGIREVKLRRLQNDETKQRLETAELIGGYGSWTYDLRTGSVTWSKGLYALLGFDADSAKPSAALYASLHTADENARSESILRKLVAGEIDSFDEQYTLTLSSGEKKHIRSKGAMAPLHELSSPTIVGTTRDITSLVEAREFAKKADHAVSRMTGVRATIVTFKHEINTPLAVAMASLELLEERMGPSSEVTNTVAALNRIALLLKNLEKVAESETVGLAEYAGKENAMLKLPKL